LWFKSKYLLLAKHPLHNLILPTILTHFAPKDLNFPELQKILLHLH
jgi:hypothetical protein